MEITKGKNLAEKEINRADQDIIVLTEDEFLSIKDLVPVKRQSAERNLKRSLTEMAELTTEKRWGEMLEIFYPVDEKIPELAEYNLDAEIRAKTAFALGQLKRFDEAIRELDICIQKEPDNFHYHSSLAYTAYNSLYAARNREILLSGKVRIERLELAHTHFKKAQELRPDGVTNYYREGMLFRQIENKEDKALPIFQKAVLNWERLGTEEKDARHQERKNYIKALYHLSGCLLVRGRAERALEFIKRCLSEDEKTNYFSILYKYFALGKVLFNMNSFSEAKDALLFALQCRSNQPVDFVYELLGRTYLAMDKHDRAIEMIRRVPEKKRKPYISWTESDIRCTLKDYRGAREVLIRCQERDRRSRHKALIRLAKLEYILGNFHQSLKHAEEAAKFFNDKWGGIFYDGIFWQALSSYRAGDMETAIRVLSHINSTRPEFQRAWAEQMELIALIGSKEEVAQVLAKAKVVAGEDVYRNLSRFLKEKSSPGGDEDVNAASAPFESYRRRHDAIERYLQLFSGREDCFARQWVNKPEGKQGYVPVRRPLEPADIEEHLRGNKTYGMYLLDSDSQVRTAVIEMKEKRPVEMKPAISRAFISAYEEMMKRNVMYRPLNKKISYRWLILQQVRSFSKYLVGPEKIYRPFLWER